MFRRKCRNSLLLYAVCQLSGRNTWGHTIVSCCLLQPVVPDMESKVSKSSAADPEKRKVYDAYGEEGLKAGAPPPVSTVACACACTCVLHLLSHSSCAAPADAAVRLLHKRCQPGRAA